MSNSKEFRDKKDRAFELYLGGKSDIAELAIAVGCSAKTICKWIKAGKWDNLSAEEKRLDNKLAISRKKALLAALDEFARDPKNVALQSLVSMLKQSQRHDAPSKEVNEYIIRFMDQTTDYMIDKGLTDLLKQYQEILMDLAEYLRLRNG